MLLLNNRSYDEEEIQMKRYNVTVNGNLYQVEVDEVKGNFAAPVAPVAAAPAPVAAAPAPVAAAPAPAAPAAAPAAPAVSNAAGEKVTAPMPGTIVKVVATKGATVKQGDVLFVLEAMKMENEIMASADGTVADVAVAQGAAVNTGDVLAVIA